MPGWHVAFRSIQIAAPHIPQRRRAGRHRRFLVARARCAGAVAADLPAAIPLHIRMVLADPALTLADGAVDIHAGALFSAFSAAANAS